jgi:hypothetical protein
MSLKAIVGVMQDLSTKTSQETFRKRKIPGIGLRSIYSALQRGKGTSRLRMADVVDAMCTSITSLAIFQFEGADAADLYFSLKGTKEEILARIQDSHDGKQFDRTEYEIDGSYVAMPAFERLLAEGDGTRTRMRRNRS